MVPLRDEVVSIMIDEHSPVLFVDETFRSLHFVIKPCSQKRLIRDMITAGGGEVVSNPGDYGITLIPPNVALIGNDEVFSIDFIKDCCAANKLLDLKPYRLNDESRFSDDFDPMAVLLKLQTWEEARNGVTLRVLVTENSPPNSGDENGEAVNQNGALSRNGNSDVAIQNGALSENENSDNDLNSSLTTSLSTLSPYNNITNDEVSEGRETPDQYRSAPIPSNDMNSSLAMSTSFPCCKTPDQNRSSPIPSDTSQFVSVSSGNSSGNDEASDGHETLHQNRNSPATKKKNTPCKEDTGTVIDCNVDTVIGSNENAVIGSNEDTVIGSNENAVIDCSENREILHIGSGSDGSYKSGASPKVVNKIVSSDSEKGTGTMSKGGATSSQLRTRSARRRVVVMDSSDSDESSVGRNVKIAKVLRLERSVDDEREASRQDNSRPSTSRGIQSRKKTTSPKSSSISLSGSDDELWKTSVARTKKSHARAGRRDYTNEERVAIIQFLKKKKWQKYVKGREMWQKMEMARVCPGRTWQSLKEHYIKKIIPNIETYGLTKEEAKKFREPFL
ncbi:dentin sialophosphoprotein-like isoform X2 [Periplaneta americana]|uniref:dentin sialophosphoprotein-like isoform X2 n=1 Tax=Periplaneta americana TaxID=6978 RepID=UPI0037E85EEC